MSSPQPTFSASYVRDLNWAILSPGLLSHTDTTPSVDSTSVDHIDPNQLAEFVQQKPSYRVGRYFESLVHFYLQSVCGFELLAHGQQVQQGGRTVGELDFVFRDHDDVVHHWETAVKFFLHRHAPHISGSHLIGPNPEDNFERKVTRMRNHQLPLSADLFPEVSVRTAFVKGRIFYEATRVPETPVNLPPDLSSAHLQGLWLHAGDSAMLRDLYADSNVRFTVMNKPFWLSGQAGVSQSDDAHSTGEIVERVNDHFSTSARPLMVSVAGAAGRVPSERNRLMIVSDRWPD